VTPEEYAEKYVTVRKSDAVAYNDQAGSLSCICFGSVLNIAGSETAHAAFIVDRLRVELVKLIREVINEALYVMPHTLSPEEVTIEEIEFFLGSVRDTVFKKKIRMLLQVVEHQKSVIKFLATDSGYEEGIKVGREQAKNAYEEQMQEWKSAQMLAAGIELTSKITHHQDRIRELEQKIQDTRRRVVITE